MAWAAAAAGAARANAADSGTEVKGGCTGGTEQADRIASAAAAGTRRIGQAPGLGPRFAEGVLKVFILCTGASTKYSDI